MTGGGIYEEPDQNESFESSVEEEKCQEEPEKVEGGEKVLDIIKERIPTTPVPCRKRFSRDVNEILP